jgi:superfamily I DNA/RNA helicase
MLDDVMHGAELPYDEDNLHTILRSWGVQWWREQLAIREGTPSLTFPMLNRLAAFLLRENRQVLAALRDTYSHVFLDEFQDTSASQWDLIRAAFLSSDASVTAVGDGKQRIMLWAGAKTDVFDSFVSEFDAERVDLVRNYRSVPELVRMQHSIALAVESGSAAPVSASTNQGAGICKILEFRTPEHEAAYLARLIGAEVAVGSAAPGDYCVLARQLVGPLTGALQAELRSYNVVLRDESALQDLRVEPLAKVVLSALRLATTLRDATRWGELMDLVVNLTGLHEMRDEPEVERLATSHKTLAAEVLAAGVGLDELPMRLINILGARRYRSTFRQYGGTGDYLEKVARDLGSTLQVMSIESPQGPSGVWDTFMGVNVLPAMTIHKSKGLEFGTVIFLGLEDSQWWGFREQPEEEKRAFFVAFSRAIGCVYFTWCDERDGRFGRQRQQRRNVEALHDILTRAGVQTLNLREA